MGLLDYVNIEVGTDSEYRESNGNTLPNVQWPFGNQAYVLQSNKNDGGWFYKPGANYTEGIRVTNQPSPWLGDYGNITLLPFTGEFNIDLHTALSNKVNKPHILEGHLDRYNIDFKLVPTKCGAAIQITNKSDLQSKLVIDCFKENTEYKLEDNILYIVNRNVSEGKFSENYRKFYGISFSCNVLEVNSRAEGSQLEVVLDEKNYRINLISSYISTEEVKTKLCKLNEQLFDNLIIEATKCWEDYLSTVEIVEEINDEKLETFYSNLYRTMCFPRIISEEVEDGTEVYYNFKENRVDQGVMISDVGFWDTYRTTMPLYEVILPSMYKKFSDAILNYYTSYGWLPRWLAPYERGIMPSTLVDSVVARSIITDVYDRKQKETAIEALLKNADTVSGDKLFGREHLKEYKQFGYVPASCHGESVSLSLDNYYSDYSIYKALLKVGSEETSRFELRCSQYKHLFNKQTKLFERLDEEGNFDESFNPSDWGFDFCESSAWQNNLNIFHDVEGFTDLFGSKQELENRLDYLFSTEPSYTVGRYGFEIHEMTEYTRFKDLGHFAISNQPSFNMPIWYLLIGREDKFKCVINKTMKYFTNQANGYPGDEDNGSLAAWYILINLGIYPFCPVDGMIEFESQFNYKINEI